MSQHQELEAISAGIKKLGDTATLQKIYGSLEAFTRSFDPSRDAKIMKAGDTLPEFILSDATNQQVSSKDLLARAQKGLLIVFYRGSWCPYCNVQLQYLQRSLEDFTARGVSLVAITPEIPDYTLTTVEKSELKFPVLSDVHNGLARKLGIVFDQSSARDLHSKIGVDLRARNQEDTWEVPIPTTALVGKDGVVKKVHFDADFRKRLDSSTAIEWIDGMTV